MTPEVIADVIRRYQAGEKAIVIQAVHNLSAGSLYYLLHKCGVELRGKPTSTKQTSGSTSTKQTSGSTSTKQTSAAATRVKQQIPKDLVEPIRQLMEQSNLEVEQFLTKYEAACAECKKMESRIDAYFECYYDLISTGLIGLINRLVEKVGPDSGITLGLIALRGILEAIEALDPDPKKEAG